MQRLCVFCGSSSGTDPEFAASARRLGQLLAQRQIELVYGGGKVGLMGLLAQTVLEQGGRVIGVIPRALVDREVALTSVTELRVVETMHERKMQMAELADGFVALPGGIGTLEEFFEVWTWGQLGLHHKPCGIYNASGYYTGLLAFLDTMAASHFITPAHRQMVLVDDEGERLLERMERYQPPTVDKAAWALQRQAV